MMFDVDIAHNISDDMCSKYKGNNYACYLLVCYVFENQNNFILYIESRHGPGFDVKEGCSSELDIKRHYFDTKLAIILSLVYIYILSENEVRTVLKVKLVC